MEGGACCIEKEMSTLYKAKSTAAAAGNVIADVVDFDSTDFVESAAYCDTLAFVDITPLPVAWTMWSSSRKGTATR